MMPKLLDEMQNKIRFKDEAYGKFNGIERGK